LDINNNKSARTVTPAEETRTIRERKGEVLILGFAPIGEPLKKKFTSVFYRPYSEILPRHTHNCKSFDGDFENEAEIPPILLNPR